MSDAFKTVKINDKPLSEIISSPWPLVSANGDIMGSDGSYLGNFGDYKCDDMAITTDSIVKDYNELPGVYHVKWDPWTVNDWVSDGIVGEEDDLVGEGEEDDIVEEEDIAIDRRNIKKLVEEVLVENGLMGPKTTNEPKGLTLRRLKHR